MLKVRLDETDGELGVHGRLVSEHVVCMTGRSAGRVEGLVG